MMRFPAIAALPFATILLAGGCADPPTDKMAAAEQAVTEARAAGAATYMAQDFAKLQGMLTAAKQEFEEQTGKAMLLRDYEKSERLLAAVQADAARIIAETGKKKDEAKAAAVHAQQAAQESVQKAQDLVAVAPVGKDRAALQEIQADVEGLAASAHELQTTMEAGDYRAVHAKAQAIQEKSLQVSSEIEHALAKIHTPKPAKKK